MSTTGTFRTCDNGHHYKKSSDCPVCPICEQNRIPEAEFLKTISAPARRALESKNISTLQRLSTFSEKELLALHGLGPSAIPHLKKALESAGLEFRFE